MSSSSSASDDDSVSSSSPATISPPADHSTCVAIRSDAVTAADRRPHWMKCTTERVVRPLIGKPTLTEEIESIVCFATRNRDFDFTDHPSLSLYASLTATERGCNNVEREQYMALSKLDWDNTTGEQRYALTTRLPHDDAMRLELDSFIDWVEDNMYVTIAEAKARGLGCPGVISEAECIRARQGGLCDPLEADFIDLICDYDEHLTEEVDSSTDPFGCTLYNFFRGSREAKPVSLLVLVEMHKLCGQPELVRSVLRTRMKMDDSWKKQIAEKAVAEAEATIRQRARAKRRKLMPL